MQDSTFLLFFDFFKFWIWLHTLRYRLQMRCSIVDHCSNAVINPRKQCTLLEQWRYKWVAIIKTFNKYAFKKQTKDAYIIHHVCCFLRLSRRSINMILNFKNKKQQKIKHTLPRICRLLRLTLIRPWTFRRT